MAPRCYHRLECLEAVEQTLDWSVRSGKIVLHIALQRACALLRRHASH
ncbi:MAG: DUF6456 domain-containing protein [Planktomarina sp.]|nr:DUF6456 domain-containing protein [Planktomarina sp.]